ncbi:MAG TPA: A/G-specific adenine glycosylase [Candidatus Angelobacter sp.]|nr:A/G-specific adenine glycosylase [Candidatus Angelobacter sp.]
MGVNSPVGHADPLTPPIRVQKILENIARQKFRRLLLRWFDREQRKLPWRGETNPYYILVSEIMLQQTRVAVVEQRYEEFLREFPSVAALAAAGEQAVLAAWSGLGYYRRARNLRAAAESIHENGEFPSTSTSLMELPGIGRYTAAAVASIAFGEPVAVVDGNVQRVLQRVIGKDSQGKELKGEAFWTTAQDLLDSRRPGDFNQAMMELGAVVCTPVQPNCSSCPVESLCVSRGAPEEKIRAPRKKATLAYSLSMRMETIFLQQRSQNLSLMAGMWELPELMKRPPRNELPILRLRHSITVTDYSVLVYSANRPDSIPKTNSSERPGKWVSLDSVHRLALTGLTRKILKRLRLF